RPNGAGCAERCDGDEQVPSQDKRPGIRSRSFARRRGFSAEATTWSAWRGRLYRGIGHDKISNRVIVTFVDPRRPDELLDDERGRSLPPLRRPFGVCTFEGRFDREWTVSRDEQRRLQSAIEQDERGPIVPCRESLPGSKPGCASHAQHLLEIRNVH